MSFWYLQFFQKTNKNIRLYYYGSSSWIVFDHFLGELKTPKSAFEINWPLAWSLKTNHEWSLLFLFSPEWLQSRQMSSSLQGVGYGEDSLSIIYKKIENLKGQLISRCLFGAIVLTKKPTIFFSEFLP